MPLAYYHLDHGFELALWKIEESAKFFETSLKLQDFPVEDALRIKHPQKRMQWFASRYVLSTLYPAAVQRNMGRRPTIFNGPHVSFSHSGEMAGVLLSQNRSGLDIQNPSHKLLAVSHKFTHPAEIQRTGLTDILQSHCLIWSIKEAVFKMYGTSLPFHDISIINYSLIDGTSAVRIKRKGISATHRLASIWVDSFAVSYLLD